MGAQAFIMNPVTGEWTAYEVFGTTPEAVLVISPATGEPVSFCRAAVRWCRPA